MWVAENNTRFRIERGFLRDRNGGEVWITVVKGVFDIRPDGTMRAAKEQDVPPARIAAWTGEPGKSSLLHDTDFIIGKTGTDILIKGHAYAPRGRPATSVDVGFRAGPLSKRLRAHGVRAWMRGRNSGTVVPGPPRPFDRVPITYENAFGGSDPNPPSGRPAGSTQNPVGTGFSYQPLALLDRAAPRLESEGAPLTAGPHEMAPVGFGPIAPHWAARACFAGTYDEAWKDGRAPLLPKDFDERFWRSAPPDQQVNGFLPPGSRIELTGLTPDGLLTVRLPEINFGIRVHLTDGDATAAAVLHTVHLLPDERRVLMVWHASYPCHGRDHKLRQAIVDMEGDRSCLSP
jgi:hypothetical protein